jgi:hypothetical protein
MRSINSLKGAYEIKIVSFGKASRTEKRSSNTPSLPLGMKGRCALHHNHTHSHLPHNTHSSGPLD